MPNNTRVSQLSYIWINLTSKCNNRCFYCYDAGHSVSEINTNTVIKILDLISELKLKQLILIGGEPTIHSNFLDILRLCSEKVKKPTIITNGFRFADELFCQEVCQIGVTGVLFSVLGPSATIHDAGTKRQGSFDQIVKGIENLRHLIDIDKIRTITTITKRNLIHLKEIIDLNISFGLKRTIFNLCTPSILEKELDLCLNPTEYSAIIEDLYLYSKKNNHFIEIGTNVPKCLFKKELIENLISSGVIRFSPCQLYRSSGIQFLSDGSVTPCTHLYDEVLGNPIERGFSISEFMDWLNYSTPKDFRENMWRYPSEECKRCKEWGNCTGGCPLMWSKHNPTEFLQAILQ
jgi:radical SAM protein with 4Fe4S-binding SPASM domain